MPILPEANNTLPRPQQIVLCLALMSSTNVEKANGMVSAYRALETIKKNNVQRA